MTKPAHLNVYKGPDSVRQYFDPDIAPPCPLVEVPDCLNPYRENGVRIYAKLMSMHPANNVKAMPALNLLQNAVNVDKTDTIVEYSSGSTVISMSMIAQVFYQKSDVRAFLSNKTSLAKLKLMQFFGLDITLFGGPSQPEPLDERGGIQAAARLAQESDRVINPNQYENDDNWKAHVRWTGPQILTQLPEITLICAGMGTSGTMTGLGTFFKTSKPSVYRLGICTAPGDRVPGPRSHALLAPVKFPWRSAVDHIEHVGSYDSYALSLKLCRQGLVCGPSSGFNLKGLYQFIEKREAEGTLKDLRGEDNEVHCVFLCCDLPYQYIDEYFSKLDQKHFPEIHNELLTDVDLYRYDESWEQSPESSLVFMTGFPEDLDPKRTPRYINEDRISSLYPRVADTVILDLRQPEDFSSSHLTNSFNFPTVLPGQKPFTDPKVLHELWKTLEAMFGTENEVTEFLEGHRTSPLLLLCYNGDCARVATSVLRAKGYEAGSVRGGYEALSAKYVGDDGGRSPTPPISSNIQNYHNGIGDTRVCI
ncbi:hypothetical protein QQX98_006335 [Neonectria punicea]|uniref:Rhodanese domain-containing protein n=1 Tax=Neonectria punicea TaxID=979145 RepID=A0ABR1H135_9HYPO